jgi:ornithine--oxo-acid transaminase
LKEEDLALKADELGHYFRDAVNNLKSPYIKAVRGKGLLNAILIKHQDKEAALRLCLELMKQGLLAKPTHGDKIRLAPPLVITEEQLAECMGILKSSLAVLD